MTHSLKAENATSMSALPPQLTGQNDSLPEGGEGNEHVNNSFRRSQDKMTHELKAEKATSMSALPPQLAGQHDSHPEGGEGTKHVSTPTAACRTK
jgi:hypothetical protein